MIDLANQAAPERTATIQRARTGAVDFKVSSRMRGPMADVVILEVEAKTPIEQVLREQDGYWLFGHSPRLPNMELCFTERWRARRFEPVGKVFLLPPNHDAHMRSQAGKQRTIACRIKPHVFEQHLKRNIEWTSERLEASYDIANPTIAALMGQLSAELTHPAFGSSIVVDACVLQIAVHLVRQFEREESAEGRGLDAWRLRAIDERLEDMAHTPSLPELAELCRLSVRQLSRGFRNSRGVSIGAYVSNRRVELAKQLLSQGAHVKSVARVLGFASSASFCNVFRRATGFAPGEYKQRLS